MSYSPIDDDIFQALFATGHITNVAGGSQPGPQSTTTNPAPGPSAALNAGGPQSPPYYGPVPVQAPTPQSTAPQYPHGGPAQQHPQPTTQYAQQPGGLYQQPAQPAVYSVQQPPLPGPQFQYPHGPTTVRHFQRYWTSPQQPEQPMGQHQQYPNYQPGQQSHIAVSQPQMPLGPAPTSGPAYAPGNAGSGYPVQPAPGQQAPSQLYGNGAVVPPTPQPPQDPHVPNWW
ncbi:hypothetical protein LTR56_013043 [Elasticomyces elasticus]|nr:hypothetical protein LTR22_025139 [Elasticomyces elasticus]KAK3638403.1 hypothetical protein LTR56_013043 [Elasticomyces elasticus]KAK4920499.1 hypothetical protein LTR49_011914 [Elasticomyces elasticus]KAK5759000.1 hypothetical protein LTS12_010941 [Elasticomyces elasticus]